MPRCLRNRRKACRAGSPLTHDGRRWTSTKASRDPALAEADELTASSRRRPHARHQAIQRALREALDRPRACGCSTPAAASDSRRSAWPRCIRAFGHRPGPQRRAARPRAPSTLANVEWLEADLTALELPGAQLRPDPHRARLMYLPGHAFERALDDLIALLRPGGRLALLRARLRRDDPRAREAATRSSSAPASRSRRAPAAVGRPTASPPAERARPGRTSPPTPFSFAVASRSGAGSSYKDAPASSTRDLRLARRAGARPPRAASSSRRSPGVLSTARRGRFPARSGAR